MHYGLLGALAKLWKLISGLVMFVCPFAWNKLSSHWPDFHEVRYLTIFRKCVEKIKVSLKSDKNNEYFTEDQYTFFLIYLHQFFSELQILQTKFAEKIKTHILCPKPFSKSRTVHEITCKNIVRAGYATMKIWNMCSAGWIPQAINTHSEYVIIIAFPLQQ